MLFARARRLLGQSVPAGAGRLGVGDVVRDGWSVLRGRNGWIAARHEGGVHQETAVFDDPRSAVVRAVAGVMAAAGVGVNSEILKTAGILEMRLETDGDRVLWGLTEQGRQIRERTSRLPRPPEDAAGHSYISLDLLDGHLFEYFVCPPGPPPSEGSFISTREVFEPLVRKLLPVPGERPGAGDDGSLTLPEGTEVDCYGGTDQVMVYTPGTPFSRRAHWGSPAYHPRHVYRVQRPLRVYPGFWFATGTEPTGEEGSGPQGESMGFYLVDSIADLLRSGGLAEVDPLGRGRWRGEWR